MALSACPKEKRIEDPAYIAWIKTISCLIGKCPVHSTQSDPHHVNKKGHGSMASRTDDTRAIPLCNHHHREFHQIGRDSFAKKHSIDYEILIEALNKCWENINGAKH